MRSGEKVSSVKGGFLVMVRVADIYTYVNLKEFGPNLSKEIKKITKIKLLLNIINESFFLFVLVGKPQKTTQLHQMTTI